MKKSNYLDMALQMWENGVFSSLAMAYDFVERMYSKEDEEHEEQPQSKAV